MPDDSPNRLLKEKLIEVISEAGPQQMQREPTRGQNLLDLFCCNKPPLVKSHISIPGISDHSIVLADCDLKATINKKPPRKVYQWSKADWQLMKEQTVIFAKQFLALALTRTVKENYTVFIEYMEGILVINILLKLSNYRYNLPWMNRNLKRLIRKKGRRFKKAKKSGMDEDRARVKRELRDAEKVYVNGILLNGLESGNNKPFWKYVKSQKQETFGISALKSNGNVITDGLSKAEIFNSEFKSVLTPQSGNTFPQLPGTQFPKIRHIYENGVFLLLDRIDVSKSSGPDKLPGRLLQSLAKEITPVVHFIFTQSLCTGELPTEWTQANVAPILKKGSKLQAVNYRSVSLICITCKLFEHIICKHILAHLEDHKILTHLQHGFRSGRSCETQLVTTFQDLAQMHNKKAVKLTLPF